MLGDSWWASVAYQHFPHPCCWWSASSFHTVTPSASGRLHLWRALSPLNLISSSLHSHQRRDSSPCPSLAVCQGKRGRQPSAGGDCGHPLQTLWTVTSLWIWGFRAGDRISLVENPQTICLKLSRSRSLHNHPDVERACGCAFPMDPVGFGLIQQPENPSAFWYDQIWGVALHVSHQNAAV